jgi:DNA sulfur modification protein DndD
VRLTALRLENFRQFEGSQRLEFVSGADHNVTLVFGANGSGKTTLLNAFTWALYGELTPDFEHPQELVNLAHWNRASDGEEVTTRVTVEFDHEFEQQRYRYTVQRTGRARKSAANPQVVRDSDVSLSFTDDTGRNYTERENPDEVIDQILPRDLHRFFFFNGERIEHLVKPTAYEEIGGAIKTLLGLEVVERAIRHLPQAQKKLEGELRQVGNRRVQEITDELDRKRATRDEAVEQRDQTKRNIAALREDRESVGERLRGLEQTSELQRERDQCETDLGSAEDRRKNAYQRIAKSLSDKGFLAFTAKLAVDVHSSFDELRTRREIPTPIKRQFVQDLLEHGECICGTPLKEGDDAYERVADWRKRAGLADVEETWGRMVVDCDRFVADRDDLIADLDVAQREIAIARSDMDRLEERLDGIKSKLGALPSEEVHDLERRREELDSAVNKAQREEFGFERDIEELERRIAELQRELDRAEVDNQRAEVARRRVTVARQCEELLRRILEFRTQDVRRELNSRIKATYAAITYKPYEPELNESFELALKNLAGGSGSVAKSTGENQILSLSFVGALAAVARARAEESAAQGQGVASLLSATGGIFPIVMDAAFGSLEESYRRDVARALPQLAPQIVVFVSKAQGLGAVEEELRARVGRTYVVEYQTPKTDAQPDQIVLRGKSYPYVHVEPNGTEGATLVEVD